MENLIENSSLAKPNESLSLIGLSENNKAYHFDQDVNIQKTFLKVNQLNFNLLKVSPNSSAVNRRRQLRQTSEFMKFFVKFFAE